MGLFPHDHRSGMFIKAPLRQVTDCLVKWGNEEKVGRNTQAQRRKATLAEAWAHVDQRQFTPNRAFLIALGEWTGFFNNHEHEWLAQAELYVLCLHLRVDTCFFSIEQDPENEQCGSAHFCCNSYAGQEESPVKERQVMTLKESRWEFCDNGEPLPFEDTEAYAHRKIRDRLTDARLRHYGEQLGIRFWDESEYATEVVFLKWGDGPKPSTLKKIMRMLGRPRGASDCGDRHIQ